MNKGFDYGTGYTNIDPKNGIRYGVIPQNEVLQAWADSSEAYYGKPQDYFVCPECEKEIALPDDTEWGDSIGCPECNEDIEVELPDFCEPLSFYLDDQEYTAECGSDGDIFVTKSLYYTRAQFCSPCAPGACYLTNPCEDGEKAYCFGHDWFKDGKAPYPVYRVHDDSLVNPES